MCQFLVAPTIT
uniref:Uncharacterized protein n=1 Tax=Rhizophora mucronata TaxID=61149 RepID=A0A2P2ILL4_RHIMU